MCWSGGQSQFGDKQVTGGRRERRRGEKDILLLLLLLILKKRKKNSKKNNSSPCGRGFNPSPLRQILTLREKRVLKSYYFYHIDQFLTLWFYANIKNLISLWVQYDTL